MTGPSERRPDRYGRADVRVRYPETDRMGVAYHGHYLAWFEIGRTELMRDLGCSYADLEDRDGIFFPVIPAKVSMTSKQVGLLGLDLGKDRSEIGGAFLKEIHHDRFLVALFQGGLQPG